jgi:hypothetical protein
MLVVNAVALSLAPTLIGFLSDLFAGWELLQRPGLVCPPGSASAACVEVAGIGLRHAFIASTPLYAWAGVHYLMAARAGERYAPAA